MMKHLLLVCLMILVVSCGSNKKDSGESSDMDEAISNAYAKGFNVQNIRDGYLITIKHPGDHSRSFQRFVLYRNAPIAVEKDVDFQLKIPLQNTAAMSVTHIGFLNAIHEIASVKGVTDPFRVYNSKVKKGIASGAVANLGESMVPDVERVLSMRPDAIFMSGFPNARENNRIIHEAGIPVIYTVAWTEKTPLARAEWVKFFGLLYDKEAMADSVFNQVQYNYTGLKNTADSVASRPEVFCGNSFKGVWYIPGGKSYVARLIEDAGGSYIFKNDTTSGSMAVSFEVVYKEAINADYWLNVQEQSITEMLWHDKRYNRFKPVKSRQVYNRLANGTLNGGNDYFETGSWRPDLVLSDIIHILHPELEHKTLKFYKRLSE